MIQRFARYIANKLAPYSPKTNVTVLSYGLDLVIYSLLSTIGLIAEGLVFRQLYTSLIIIAVFYLNQTIGGGFHANSHMSCFLTMTTGLTFGLFICSLDCSTLSMLVVGIFSCLSLYWHPVVLHPNKQYLETQMHLYIRRSRYLTIFESIIGIMMILFLREIFMPYTIGLLMAAFSRLAGKYKRTS